MIEQAADRLHEFARRLLYQALFEPSRVTVLLQSSPTCWQLAAGGTYIGPMPAE